MSNDPYADLIVAIDNLTSMTGETLANATGPWAKREIAALPHLERQIRDVRSTIGLLARHLEAGQADAVKEARVEARAAVRRMYNAAQPGPAPDLAGLV